MIDIKDFNLTIEQAFDHVRFYLYEDSKSYLATRITYPELSKKEFEATADMELRKKGFLKNDNSACFAGLPGQLGIHGHKEESQKMKDANRVIFFPIYSKTIKEEHIIKWIELSKKHGLLPKYCNYKDVIAKNAFVFDIKAHTLNMLFVYLCMARFLAADPTFVVNVLKLSSKYKINFLVALVYFSYTCIKNSNHHFIDINSLYPRHSKISPKIRADLGVAVGLFRFIKNNGLPDNVKEDFKPSNYYCAKATITSIYNKSHHFVFEQLNSSYIPKMLKLPNAGIEMVVKKMKVIEKHGPKNI